ncbi:hypothetical protein DdX_18606 [Ditylenchus destructor]|uniref:Uncharacterized protein n=1 Tax=Ditylenchus destructor TaxID=166010 RepID=A0AAD4MLZ6_9BILA|nr:hypothetical protein DdX_18606 [Ditylenchus destructor]
MGGVCHLPADDCPGKPDMILLEYEFVVFETENDIQKDHLDAAIIQLKESINETLAERIGFACLPTAIDEQPPSEITMVGWPQRGK